MQNLGGFYTIRAIFQLIEYLQTSLTIAVGMHVLNFIFTCMG